MFECFLTIFCIGIFLMSKQATAIFHVHHPTPMGVTNYRNHRELPKSPKNLPKSPQNVPKSPAHLKDIYLLVSKM